MNKLNTNKFFIVIDLNSLSQTINNLVKTRLFKSSLMLSLFLAFSIISSGTDYDGICPTGATSYTDCDCNPGGMANFVAIDIKDTSDYASIIHIDPDANDPNENGSAAHPYNSWFDVSWSSNTAYVQKRGTTFSSTVTISTGASNIMLGAYGSGDKPNIINTSTGNNTLNIENYYVLIRDLCLQAPNMTNGIILFLRGNADYVIVFQCDICNCGWEAILSYADYGHIIGCNIYNIGQDAIWISQTPYFEIAYNNMYNINQSWYPGAPMNVSGGDGIQVENDYEEIWIHHNTIDHGDTGNKGCVLLSSNEYDQYNEPYQYTCNRAITEFNTMIAPKNTIYGGYTLNLDQGDYHTVRYNKFYAAEVVSGAYPDSMSIGIYTSADHDSIYGNVFVDFDEAIHSSTSSQEIIANNTFYNTQNYINIGSGSHAKFYNNIFDQNLFSGVTVDAEADNMFVSGTPWANSFSGDPDYVNAGNNDFRLQSTSDAIDEGTSLSYYMYDIEMNEISGTIDVGANEYSSSQDTIPNSPSSLTVTNITQTSIGIGWSDNSNNEDKFIIERSLYSGSGFAVIDSVNANVTSYTSTGLSSNTTYYFKVKARNSYGDSGYSNTANGTTQDTTSLRNIAINKTATQISTAYDAYASLAVDNNTDGNWNNGSVATTNYENYAWWQVDLDSVFYVESIDIWNRTDCCMDKLDSFYVFVSENTFTSTDIATTIAQSGVNSYYFTDYPNPNTSLSVGENGRYVRVQLNRVNNYLAIAEVKVWGSDTTEVAPDAPSNLSATDSTTTTITIGWTDNSDNEDKFIIERSLSSGSGFAVIDSVNANVTSYTDTGLSSSTTYYYKVKARNSYGDSGYSNEESATTLGSLSVRNVAINKTATQISTAYDAYASLAVDNNTDGNWDNGSVATTQYENYPWWQVDLDSIFYIESIEPWNRTGCCQEFLSNYYVFVSENAFTSTDIATTIAQGGVNSYYFSNYPDPDTSFSVGETGRYIRFQRNTTNTYMNIAEVKIWGTYGSGSTPEAPSQLNSTDSTASTITIGWTDNASNEEKFIIERSLSYGSGFAVIDSVGADTTSYVDTGLILNTTYYYKVKAKNDYGTSAYSNTASASTLDSSIIRNLAINKTATQISTAYDAYASLAVDNNTDGNWDNGSVATTQYENYPWWQVDLDSIFYIESIEPWNRTGCCQEFLSNYYVFVSENAFTSTDIATTIAQGGVNSYYFSNYPDPDTSFSVGETGRYIRFQRNTTNTYMNIAEVKVWGYEEDLKKTVLSEEINPGLEPEKPISVYPNPGSTMITISGFEQAVEIKMVDMLGKVVYLEGKVNNSTQIDVSSLKKGLYLILVKKENNIYVTKFIKN